MFNFVNKYCAHATVCLDICFIMVSLNFSKSALFSYSAIIAATLFKLAYLLYGQADSASS